MIGWYFKKVDPVVARVWTVLREKSTREFIGWEVKKSAWVQEFHEKVRLPRLYLSPAGWYTTTLNRSGMLTVSTQSLGQAWVHLP